MQYWGNSYGYDAWGNLLAKTITKCGAENLSVTAAANNQLQGGYTYDSAGNMLHDATANLNYSYDQDNRITGAAGYAYTYDGDGNRVQKSNGSTGTLYWYLTPGIVAESDLSGNLTSEYVFFDGERVARRDTPSSSGPVLYYFSDQLKTASVVTDAAGNIKAESDYYPWGGELEFTANDSNHYKFTGKERDAETGLDYFGARYYSNGLGRFITPDWSVVPVPVPYADLEDPQSLNQYSYVRNIPTTKVDLDGHGCPPDCETEVEYVEGMARQTLDQLKPLAPMAGPALAAAGPAVVLTLPSAAAMTAVVVLPPMQNHPADDPPNAGDMMLDALNPSYQPAPPLPGPAPTPNTQPAPNTQPQTPPAPQAAAEHDKGKRKSTKDDHERRRPGTSPPPNYKPDRKYVQPKDDKKKDKKDKPYHRKDRDKKQEAS